MAFPDIVLSSLPHTWIIDLDGTVVQHNGYLTDGKDTLLPGVKEFFAQIPEQDMIIFLSSRKECFREMTISFLQEHHLRYDLLILDAPMGERILLNDDKPSGLTMAKCVPLPRNHGLTLDLRIDDTL